MPIFLQHNYIPKS